MFLKQIIKKNKQFIDETLKLYKKGLILPDTYCIDVDTFLENSKKILDEAKKYNIETFYMLKQLGRNPYLGKKLEEMGYNGAVLVDFKEVELAMKNNLKLGNIGHLVQIPYSMIPKCLKYGVEIFTTYSLEIIKKIDLECKKLNKIQDIMLRIVDEDSNIYPGQEAGISLNELDKLGDEIKKLSNVRLRALTSFPCFLYSEEEEKILETNNIKTIKKAKQILESKGFKIDILNMPSVSSVENMEMIYRNGGVQAEPGHALSGTHPYAVLEKSVEIPSYLYISEISHNFRNKSYFYGGGYYPRSHMKYGYIDGEIVEVNSFNPGNIDYYLSLDGVYDVFKPIILCFRTQMFVTRSDIVLIEGIKEGNPRIIGRYSSLGERKDCYE